MPNARPKMIGMVLNDISIIKNFGNKITNFGALLLQKLLLNFEEMTYYVTRNVVNQIKD